MAANGASANDRCSRLARRRKRARSDKLMTVRLPWSVIALVAGCSFEGAPGPAPADPDGGPDASGPRFRKPIVIEADQVDGAQSNFPVWVEVQAPELSLRATADGSDLHFRLPGGGPVPYELVQWNRDTGRLAAWVRLDLADAEPTVFELHYGAPDAAPSSDAPAVFQDGFAAVWHFDDALATSTVADATAQLPATAINGVTATAGHLGGGFRFDGVDDEVSFTNMFRGPTAGSSHTISAWIKVSTPSAGFGSLLTVGDSRGGASRWMHTNMGGLAVGFFGPDFGSSGPVADDQLHFVQWTWDAVTRESRVYVDSQVKDTDAAMAGIVTDLELGHIGNAPQPWGPGGNTPNPILGLVDEVWISTVARSPGWIQTAYNNQRTPETFYRVDPEESVP